MKKHKTLRSGSNDRGPGVYTQIFIMKVLFSFMIFAGNSMITTAQDLLNPIILQGGTWGDKGDILIVNDDESTSKDAALRLKTVGSGGYNDWVIFNYRTDGALYFTNYNSPLISDKNTGIPRMKLTKEGNLGIGLLRVSPTSKLTVNGDIRMSNNNKGLVWGNTSWVNTYSRILEDGNLKILTDDNFYIGDINPSTGAPGATRFYINTNSGNVGIGTTSPSEKLHVNGSVLANNLWVSASNNGTNDYAGLKYDGSGNLIVGADGFIQFHETDQNSAKMTLNLNTGRLGIGTTNPSQKLEVSGNIKANVFIGDGSQLTNLPTTSFWSQSGSTLSYSGTAKIDALRITDQESATFANTDGLVIYDRNFSGNGETGAGFFNGDGGGLSVYNEEDGWSALVDTKNMSYLNAAFNSLHVANDLQVDGDINHNGNISYAGDITTTGNLILSSTEDDSGITMDKDNGNFRFKISAPIETLTNERITKIENVNGGDMHFAVNDKLRIRIQDNGLTVFPIPLGDDDQNQFLIGEFENAPAIGSAFNKPLYFQANSLIQAKLESGTFHTYGSVTADGQFNGDGSGLTNINTESLSGTLAENQLPTISTAGKVSGDAITFGTIGGAAHINTTGDISANAFIGDGSGLTNINIDNISGLNLGSGENGSTHTGDLEVDGAVIATEFQGNNFSIVNGGTQNAPTLLIQTILPNATVTALEVDPGANTQITRNLLVYGDIQTAQDLEVSGGIVTTGDIFTGNGKFVGDGSGLTSLNASNISAGTIAEDQLPTISTPGKVLGDVITSGTIGGTTVINTTGDISAATLTGDGSGLTGLDASNISSGTIAESQLPTISTAGKVSGNAITSGTIGGATVINTTGNISANTFAGDGSGLTGLDASSISAGTIAEDQLPTILTPGKVSGNAISSGIIGGSTELKTNALISTSNNIEALGTGKFIGNGSELTALNASNVSMGTLAEGHLPIIATAGKVSGDAITFGTIGGATMITTTGDISASLFNGDGSGLTGLNASNISSGTIPESQLPTIASAGKVSGDAINSGTIGGSTALNTSGEISSSDNITVTGTGKFIGDGSGLTNILVGSFEGVVSENQLPVITIPGKVSGDAINSGIIGGSTVINTSGQISSSGNITVTGSGKFIGDGSQLTGTTPWTKNGANISYDGDHVMVDTLVIGTPPTLSDLTTTAPAEGFRNIPMTVYGGLVVTSPGNSLIDSEVIDSQDQGNFNLWVEDGIMSEGFWVTHPCIWDGSGDDCPDTWGDFVFDKDYHLRPLKEVKAFIEKNHHLPGIPSAEEVKEGYELHDMNKNFIVKIEELTLYTLSQEQEIERLTKEKAEQDMQLMSLASELAALKALVKAELSKNQAR